MAYMVWHQPIREITAINSWCKTNRVCQLYAALPLPMIPPGKAWLRSGRAEKDKEGDAGVEGGVEKKLRR